MHIMSGAAGKTETAGHKRMHDNGVANRNMRDRRTDGMHPAGILVPERVGQRDVGLLFPLTFDDVQIGAAQSRAADAHDYVKRPADLRIGDLFHDRFLQVVMKTNGFHVVSSGCGAALAAKRAPGAPQVRKKSPVLRHNSTFTALPARMSDALKCRARAVVVAVAGAPETCATSGECAARFSPAS